MPTPVVISLLSLASPFLVLLACADKGANDSAANGGADEPAGGDDTAEVECGPANDPDVLSALDIEGDPTCGEPIYMLHCAGCHGTDGGGAEPGPAIGDHVVSHTDEELLFVLLVGQDEMPAQGLGNRENAHVLAWLRDTFGEYNGTGH